MVPAVEQRRVFVRPPAGMRKVGFLGILKATSQIASTEFPQLVAMECTVVPRKLLRASWAKIKLHV